MRAYQQRRLRQKLELISSEISQSFTHSALTLVHALRRSLQNTWLPSKEPRIQQTLDGAGKLGWIVYDPMSDRALTFHTEQDLLTWLEERHYRAGQGQVSFFGF